MNQADLDALIERHGHAFCSVTLTAQRDGCPLNQIVVMLMHPSSRRYATWRKEPSLSTQTVLGEDGLLLGTTRELAIMAANADKRVGMADNLRKLPEHGAVSLLVFHSDGTDDDCLAHAHVGVCHEDESRRGRA